MNLRNILKIYNLERQLTTDDVALLNTLRGMNESDKDLLVESLTPQKVATRKAKTLKFEHCDVCNYTKRHQVHKDSSRSDYHEFQSPKPSTKSSKKSQRAAGMASAISDSLQRSHEAKLDDDDDDTDNDDNSRCQFICSDNRVCNLLADHNIHHLKAHVDHHEFVEGKSHALAAGGE